MRRSPLISCRAIPLWPPRPSSSWRSRGAERPTHLFLQAGVGSFAGAALGFFTSVWGEERPVTAIVEPDRADCLFRTAQADDGALHFVTGDMDSMMAGLCCGEPCTISWKIIDAYADAFLSCGDGYAARGMRLLARPEEGDPAVVSGESGAVTAGGAGCPDAGRRPVRGAAGAGPERVLLGAPGEHRGGHRPGKLPADHQRGGLIPCWSRSPAGDRD